jgi:hypothetical protein
MLPMARPLRIEFAGVLYHVTSRGNERKPVYRDDRDRARFLGRLSAVVGTHRLHSWLVHLARRRRCDAPPGA